ncbi:histidine kinase CKI1 [Trifolium repens]|jgi:hypothetical protein|nr:histidine kinase CKI1 [Trifolium repens]
MKAIKFHQKPKISPTAANTSKTGTSKSEMTQQSKSTVVTLFGWIVHICIVSMPKYIIDQNDIVILKVVICSNSKCFFLSIVMGVLGKELRNRMFRFVEEKYKNVETQAVTTIPCIY